MTPQALTSLMEAHRLDVKEVAFKIFVSPRCVAHWVKGDRRIPRVAWELLTLKLQGSGGVMSVGDSWSVSR